jgi:hypothetical protein
MAALVWNSSTDVSAVSGCHGREGDAVDLQAQTNLLQVDIFRNSKDMRSNLYKFWYDLTFSKVYNLMCLSRFIPFWESSFAMAFSCHHWFRKQGQSPLPSLPSGSLLEPEAVPVLPTTEWNALSEPDVVWCPNIDGFFVYCNIYLVILTM